MWLFLNEKKLVKDKIIRRLECNDRSIWGGRRFNWEDKSLPQPAIFRKSDPWITWGLSNISCSSHTVMDYNWFHFAFYFWIRKFLWSFSVESMELRVRESGDREYEIPYDDGRNRWNSSSISGWIMKLSQASRSVLSGGQFPRSALLNSLANSKIPKAVICRCRRVQEK
jgi:hypothetical protein